VSELNKVLRRNHRKRLGGDAPVFEEVLAPEIAPSQTEVEVEDVGTKPQERDLLRMLLNYGHLKIIVPIQNDDGSFTDEEITVAELLFQSLAVDEIYFDEPVFQAIYFDYRHTSNLGEQVEGSRYANHAEESWRSLSIDLLTEKHQLSPNWRARHKIQVSRDSDKLLDAIEEGVDILKERRVDRMIREKQEELKTADEMNTIITLQEIVRLNEVKKALAKRTGRVVVG
jgi:DNA primase